MATTTDFQGYIEDVLNAFAAKQYDSVDLSEASFEEKGQSAIIDSLRSLQSQDLELGNIIADYQGQIESIGTSQAVIHFDLDGTIWSANDNFLKTLGYTLREVQGQHHSMFVEPGYRESLEYRGFWEAFNRGEAQVGEFKRLGKNGKEVWIQASYTPIKDLNGKPFKVVKYAVDVTAQKIDLRQRQAIDKKVFSYQEDEVSKFAKILGTVADGDLRGRYCAADADADTEHVAKIFGEISIATNRMMDSLLGVVLQANTIAKGDYSRTVDIKGSTDLLGNAINQMIGNIRRAKEQNDCEQWLKTGHSEISSAMQGEQDLPTLATNVITYLGHYLDVPVGAFYVADEAGLLHLTGSYAYDHRKYRGGGDRGARCGGSRAGGPGKEDDGRFRHSAGLHLGQFRPGRRHAESHSGQPGPA